MTIQANQGFGVSVFGATGSGGGGTTSPGGSSLQIQYNAAGSFGGMAGTSWDNTNRSLTLTGATVTTSNPVLNLSQTWNAGAVTFKGWVLNVTDTASASASLLMDLQVGGSSKFSVDKSGYVTAPRYYWQSDAFSYVTNSRITFTPPGATYPLDIGSHSVGFGAITTVGWWSNNIVGNGSVDLILGRNAAASLRLGAADAAAPVAQTLGVQSVVAGTTNTAGVNFTIKGSAGTGTGAGGSIIFQTAAAGGSGTAQNAFATALTIDSTKLATFAGNVKINTITLIDQAGSGQLSIGNGYYLTANTAVGLQIANLGYPISWSSSIGGSSDLFIYRDAANTLALRNGTSAQTLRSYRSYTDASNYSRLALAWNTTTALVMAEGAGTGSDGSVAFNDAALATNATVGFVMIPSCAGTPSGTPADIPTGQIPMVWDSTNLKLYVYTGGAWKASAAFT